MKRTRLLLFLDTALFAALFLLLLPRTSGLVIHEWLGVAVIPFIILHLLWAWHWIAGALKRVAAKGAWRLRVNVLLNLALFIAFVVTTFTGVMTSFVVLPAFGIAPGDYAGWLRLHNLWRNLVLLFITIHIA